MLSKRAQANGDDEAWYKKKRCIDTMSPIKHFKIETDSSDQRLDVFLSDNYPEISRTKIQKCIEDSVVLLNGKKAKKRTTLNENDVVEVDEGALTSVNEINLEPQNIPLDILYEDDHFVAINKPAGMVVHPGSGNREGTMVNALLYHLDSLSEGSARERPGIVHRLDKNTSGVIVVAKNDTAHNALAALFAERKINKEYLGFCIGIQPKDKDLIDAPIGRKKNDPLRFCVRQGGKEAQTEYTLLVHRSGISHITFHPKTGRTHQIRIHSSHAGFAVVQDNLYGGDKKKIMHLQPLDRPFAYSVFKCFSRHALHAQKLSFIHPFTDKRVSFEAPLPEDFRKAVGLFGDSE